MGDLSRRKVRLMNPELRDEVSEFTRTAPDLDAALAEGDLVEGDGVDAIDGINGINGING